MAPFLSALMFIGYATGFLLFLSPVLTFRRIIRDGATQQYSGVPYVVTLLSCMLSAWYDMPFISPKNTVVAILNGVGALIELAYVVIFLVYAPKKERIRISVLLVAVIGIFSTIACVSVMVFPEEDMNNRRTFCGFSNVGLSIVMYASPLSIMMMVIRTKSVQYMPFLPSVFIFLTATTWSCYGFIANDKFIYIPNTIGSILGAVQLILYAIYCRNKGPLPPAVSTTL